MTPWYGKFLGTLAGALLLRGNPLLGGLLGLLLGHAFDAEWFAGSRHPGPRNDPYRVLGLADGASAAEVDQAYRRLVGQCHPDRLGDVPDEVRRLAEDRVRDINAAYKRIRARGRKPG